MEAQLVQALQRLRAAIDILDDCNAPAHIAAHVDLAAHQLQEFIDRATGSPTRQIETKAEPH